MEIQDYLNKKKDIQQNLLDYLDDEEEDGSSNEHQFIKWLNDSKISENRAELTEFINLLLSVANNHRRSSNFFDKIEKIILILDIKQTYSNIEIYNIFQKNKRLLSFVVNSNILSVSDLIEFMHIADRHFRDYQSVAYFWPELNSYCLNNREYWFRDAVKSFLTKDQYSMRFDEFTEKRKKGENDQYILELIRKDDIIEFVQYVTKHDYKLNSNVKYSIFESNNFLCNDETTLIEYAAFFGSIQIFQYLNMNNVDLSSMLIFYAIHSDNAELIHLIEELKIDNDVKNKSQKYFSEAVECHHNDLADYYKNNSVTRIDFIPCFQHFNYICFPKKWTNEKLFTILCAYNYPATLEVFLKTADVDINEKRILNQLTFFLSMPICYAYKKNYKEIIDILLSHKDIQIGKEIFKDLLDITQISIPPTIKVIGERSFLGCTYLKEVVFTPSITTIENEAFKDCCKLVEIKNLTSVTTIGERAFQNCNLINVSLPSTLTKISKSCFHGCKYLICVELPSTITVIEERAFYDCPLLKHISIPSSVKYIGKLAFSGCSSISSITIPSLIEKIEDNTFDLCSSLEKVINHSQFVSIGKHAFTKCVFKEFTIPSTVTSIDDYAFADCVSLEQISIPSSVTFIGDYAFQGCLLLKQIEIPSSVKSVGSGIFYNCSSLEQITILAQLALINGFFCSSCKSLKKIELPSSITAIKYNAFSQCNSLEVLNIPSSVTTIEEFCFDRCSKLSSLAIPSSVKEIKNSLCKDCVSLTEITIPPSVESIGFNAFRGCLMLKFITIPSSVKSIDNYAFYECKELQSLVIPESVISIGTNAFFGCSSLKEIEIPSSITLIAIGCFRKCASLEKVTIPSSVTSIKSMAFGDCQSLFEVMIPSSLTKIEESAFPQHTKIQIKDSAL